MSLSMQILGLFISLNFALVIPGSDIVVFSNLVPMIPGSVIVIPKKPCSCHHKVQYCCVIAFVNAGSDAVVYPNLAFVVCHFSL